MSAFPLGGRHRNSGSSRPNYGLTRFSFGLVVSSQWSGNPRLVVLCPLLSHLQFLSLAFALLPSVCRPDVSKVRHRHAIPEPPAHASASSKPSFFTALTPIPAHHSASFRHGRHECTVLSRQGDPLGPPLPTAPIPEQSLTTGIPATKCLKLLNKRLAASSTRT